MAKRGGNPAPLGRKPSGLFNEPGQKEDLAELSQTASPEVETPVSEETEDQTDVSLDDVSASEEEAADEITEDTDTSNS